MQKVLRFLPLILTAAPALIQLVENAFGGQVTDRKTHEQAVVNLILTLLKDAAQLGAPPSPPPPGSRLFGRGLATLLARPAVKAFYDTKQFLAGQATAPGPEKSPGDNLTDPAKPALRPPPRGLIFPRHRLSRVRCGASPTWPVSTNQASRSPCSSGCWTEPPSSKSGPSKRWPIRTLSAWKSIS